MTTPKKAFVLAAGFGTRMRPLTDNCPKPLLEVAGQTMLDRALDALAAVGVEEVIVNAHYLGHMIEDALKGRKTPRITVVHEDEILDTGGGVAAQLSFFGDEPFYVLNADVLWTDDAAPALSRLADAWDGTKMDLLFLVQDVAAILGWERGGDYFVEEDKDCAAAVFQSCAEKPANTVFMGPRIVHPRLFKDAPSGTFSFLDLFHKAEAAGRLYALRHKGAWHHVGTPKDFEETNRILSAPPAKKHAM
ncbi:MAG: nucleotidyltransferase family protein [Alphaproteobacteria bacterium]|nr:nucleotidyltransferase family protein [Alphaproteobacteria bacterium]